jgi:hypothetical protein
MRKILLAIAALAVAGTAASTVTVAPAAAASWNNNHRHHIWRPSVRYFAPAIRHNNCYVRRIIHTPFGPRVDWVNRCYY